MQGTWFQVFEEGDVTLGFEDNNYRDNGYIDSTPTSGQRTGLGPASVHFNINRA